MLRRVNSAVLCDQYTSLCYQRPNNEDEDDEVGGGVGGDTMTSPYTCFTPPPPLSSSTSYDRVRRRIFVCTTMYRESDYEMTRLLKSIKTLGASACLDDVDVESHIFIDNGARGDDILEFARQLLELIAVSVKVDVLSTAAILAMPYGLQVALRLPEGVPVRLHLKDVDKVKAKKRWSQVMYMEYIVRYVLPEAWHTQATVLSDLSIISRPRDSCSVQDISDR